MPSEVAAKTVVYRIPGMENAVVRGAVPYRPGLTMDLYYPPGRDGERLPAVVIVLGYRDAGVATPFGCQFREMGMTISWAQLFTACGMIGVVYETSNPAEDAGAVISALRADASALGIDPERIGIWAASGNVPTALSVLTQHEPRCAALFYGFMLDLHGKTNVARTAAQFHFANPPTQFPGNTPLFIARAGQDQFPGLTESIDDFVAEALRLNLPLTCMNHATGQHAFDLMDDNAATRAIVKAALAFLQTNLAQA